MEFVALCQVTTLTTSAFRGNQCSDEDRMALDCDADAREHRQRMCRRADGLSSVFQRGARPAARAAALSASVDANTKLRSLSACCACSMNRFDCSYCARVSAFNFP